MNPSLTTKSYDLIRNDKDSVKEIAVNFFYWWHNQSGSNTSEGFDEYIKLQEAPK